ncbi:DUF4280 domain-containing protein [Chryseobacterium camelliae]|uniref:DUF4280 domain-containing protein n=1 Tax=Chryseobacterium camelliae TaxID=1265445 RepID=A0ABY7QJL0_9FLAO|nr:DUF4280 domain-containing protein [Chryseobacterium camelliae]WBV59852.1 DUF4280 domain-containing protein [Chryseobacterium camelliae]
MKTYFTQPNDTFSSLAKRFNIKDGNYLKTFHNLYCEKDSIMNDEVEAGKQILIPDDPQFMKEETKKNAEKTIQEEPFIEEGEDYEFLDKGTNTNNESEENPKDDSAKEAEEKQNNEQPKENTSSEHDGKYFVIQNGTCQCNQGFSFPQLKVTSHQKHYWNNADMQADFLAVTEDDLQFNPAAQPFGQCKLKPTSGGYLPCAYAPAGKWQKTYDKVKVLGKSCVTELSELMCSTGGKITILKHGQQSEVGKSSLMTANSQEQNIYNPIINFEEFKAEVNTENNYAF